MSRPSFTLAGVCVCFATPRGLPKAAALGQRVVVMDIAFASESGGKRGAFDHTTLKLIDTLGERLVGWVDHHDSDYHRRYADDDRFVLATKAEHGACPEMVDAALVERLGPVDTIVCHTDFDGIATAVKWLLGGQEPYVGCDDDARAIDTRIGEPSPRAGRLDRALRAKPRHQPVMEAVARDLYGESTADDQALLDRFAAATTAREAEAERLAGSYGVVPGTDLVWVDATGCHYDRTALLLRGQQLAKVALVVDGDNATFAAPFDSGLNFVAQFGLSGGMPTLVSINRARLPGALATFGADDTFTQRLMAPPANSEADSD